MYSVSKIKSNWIMFSTSLELSLGDNLLITQRYFSYPPVAFFDPSTHWVNNICIYIYIIKYDST